MFNAQRDFPTAGSWISEVQGVLESCEINFTEDKIMSQFKLRKIVKEKIQVKVLVYTQNPRTYTLTQKCNTIGGLMS